MHHSDTATRAGMVRALNAGVKPKSTHYSVDRDGSVAIHADPLESTAWHCVGANLHGIGIDAIHRKRQPFPDVQVAAVGALLRWLCKIHGLPQVAAEGRFPTKGQLGRQSWGVAVAGFLTVAQFSFWGNYLPRVYPTHLRGTGESFAANIGGRMIGTSFAWLTATIAGLGNPIS